LPRSLTEFVLEVLGKSRHIGWQAGENSRADVQDGEAMFGGADGSAKLAYIIPVP
jgi:hypothetical protein